MGAEEHKKNKVENIGFAVITISDTRTEETDTSGILVKELLSSAGHRVTHYKIIKDEAQEITFEAQRLLDMDVPDAIIICGGSGVSKRDVTIEAIRPLFEKELDGFGEVFRYLSMDDIGSAAIMSRATAGIAKEKVIFCIPGSKGAVKLALEKLILEECCHILWEARR